MSGAEKEGAAQNVRHGERGGQPFLYAL